MNYFYPEMIPEPDYSDSGDEAGSEDENKTPYAPDRRPALERLRDLTEVYVSDINVKKEASKAKKTPSKQAGPAPKTATKQASKTTAKGATQAKNTPKSPPKPPAKKQSKSPSEVSKARRSPSPTAKRSKSPTKVFRTTGSPPPAAKRSKSPTKVFKTTGSPPAAVKRSRSPDKVKKPVSKTKPPAKPAAVTAREGTPKPAVKRTPSPKAVPKTKAATEKPTAIVTATQRAATPPTSVSGSKSSSAPSTEQSSDDEQLIKPRKPYTSSSEKQKLHKELKFSQKYGKLGSPKTELQLALERYTENKERREMDAEEKNSLEKILEYQAKKIEMQESTDKDPAWLEQLQRPPSTFPNPKTDEFFRVHAKVVSSNILTQCFLEDDGSSSHSGDS